MLAVLLYGAFIVFALGLIPAFVICFRKEEWIAIAVGFLTFGVGWWVGSLRGESGRRVSAVAALLCAVLALGVLAARPGQFFGIDARALEHSVAGWWAFEGKPCRQISDADWICGRSPYDRGSGEEVVYRVHVDRLGCWHGFLIEDFRNGDAARISGCVHLVDFL